MPFLTLFSAPKPFTNPHIRLIQRNAIQSWRALGADVQVILIGVEEGVEETAHEFGACYLPQVERNSQGTPLVSSMFDLARQHSDSPLLAYVNADILLMPDFLQTARLVCQQAEHFLIVGQRWDLEITTPLAFEPGWEEELQEQIRQRGRLHPRGGSDYFIFPRHAFMDMPAFAVGRAGWDNWMLYEARQRGWKLIDATGTIDIVHQEHDYSHLPGGQPHYRQPETFENIRLAGGRIYTRFTLEDTNTRMHAGSLVRRPLTWKRLVRELEIFPMVRLHSKRLARLTEALVHPKRVYAELRARRGEE
jgi:hypothetical protein